MIFEIFFLRIRTMGNFNEMLKARQHLKIKNVQEHFHQWITKLKYLYAPKMTEEQAINSLTKHFPIKI